MSTKNVNAAMEFISSCSDPAKLEQLAVNAGKKNEPAVRELALRRLFSILPDAEEGSFEHGVWQSIHAQELALKEARGKAVRLTRTRQKITRDGELKTVAALVTADDTEGFDRLAAWDMLNLSLEAVVLAFADRFEGDVLTTARKRLEKAGYDTAA